ncbi:MAG: CopG family transcriptional regulator [Sediminispirochaetaceae bacterium]
MGQITIYLDDETERKMKRVVRAQHVSQSRWVAELIRSRLRERWPESVREIPGSWKDAPTAEELRGDLGADYTREEL